MGRNMRKFFLGVRQRLLPAGQPAHPLQPPLATLEKFVAAVQALPVSWYLEGSAIRVVGTNDCPITAVARARGHNFDLGAYRQAAKKIGLPIGLAGSVALAADGRGVRDVDPSLWCALLIATGLLKPEPSTAPDSWDTALAALTRDSRAASVPDEPTAVGG